MLRNLLFTLFLSALTAPMVVAANSAPSASSSQQLPMQLHTAQGTLYGTLLKPKSTQAQTVALLIAGSGATDRNGNNPEGGHNDSLKRLAQGLAKQGIASLRYDKRGVAASQAATPNEQDLTLEQYVDDAVEWARQLKADPAFDRVVLVGHSEGALIASLAAERAQADAVVSIAGSFRPIGELLRDQLAARLPADLQQQSNRLLDLLSAGKTTDEVPNQLQFLFRPSVQPYLVSLLRQDPGQAFANLSMPALIVQGTHDIQVSMADAQGLKSVKPDAEVLIVPSMNHVMRIVPMDFAAQLASYNNPQQPLAGGVAEYIGLFILHFGEMPSSS